MPALPDDKYPFVYNWQLGGAPRWLSWLFQAGGTFIGEDGTTPTIDSAEGEKALDFTKSFFENNWVPPTSSTKGTVYADNLFTEEHRGDGVRRIVPRARPGRTSTSSSGPPSRCLATQRGATDLGGNALVATKDTEEPRARRRVPEVHGLGRRDVLFLRRDERAAHAYSTSPATRSSSTSAPT